MLTNIVLEIVESNPQGLSHAKLVKLVLISGYKHTDELPLSVCVHKILKSLVSEGVIYRNQDDAFLERKYLIAN